MSKYNDSGTSSLESMSQAGFYNQWTLNKFRKYLKGKILEVGCGIGNFTLTLAKFGDVTAIDLDPNLINKFKKNQNSKIEAGFGDIEKGEYFFKSEFFDTIVCVNVLEHIDDDTKALKNMYQLLDKRGHLILLVPIHKFLFGEIDKSVGHFRRYNPGELVKKMEDIGYKIITSKRLNFLGAIGWFISGRLLKNTHISENKIKLFNIFFPVLYLENLLETPIGTSVLIIAKRSDE